MFCEKCGKSIEIGTICFECKQGITPVVAPVHISETKKAKRLRLIRIVVGAVAFITLIIFGSLLLSYTKNHAFSNGIAGDYVCVETLPTFKGVDAGYTQIFLDDYYSGATMKVSKKGVISEFRGFTSTGFNLECTEDYFDSFEKSYISYVVVEANYTYTNTVADSYAGPVEIYFSKKGSQKSADSYFGKDTIEVYFKPRDYTSHNWAFILTFEKE